MCGILGQFSFNPESFPSVPTYFRDIFSLMYHRGSDSEGIWTDNKHCILGSRRLAILDPTSCADQPMLSQNGRYVIVYNGEVYNFHDLRRELKTKGYSFLSRGDTEVVLYALVEWDIKALDRFNGMFALGFYDTYEKKLLLARGHAGIKPLYYMTSSKGFVFASGYDQILAHPWTEDCQVSQDALKLYLRLGFIPAPYALLNNTHLLEPGTWLKIDLNGTLRKGKHYEFPIHNETILEGEEAIEALDHALNAAVKRHLISDVPVGTFLSGGIDSPLITAKAHNISTGKLTAVTLGTNGDEFDESPDACLYARQIGIPHQVEHINTDQLFNLLNDVIKSCGEPFGDYSIFPMIFISNIARRKAKVMISGDGGDELFFGYYERVASILKYAEHLKSQNPLCNKAFKNNPVNKDPSQISIGDRYMLAHSKIPSEWFDRLFPDISLRPEGFTPYHRYEPQEISNWIRCSEFTGNLAMVLLKVDRASMYHSIEVRVPFLDKEVLEVASKISWKSCLDFDKGIGKLPLRNALNKYVKHQTVKKKGFTVSMGDWLRGPFRSIFEENVLSRKDLLGQPVDNHEVTEFFNRHLAGKEDHAWGLWVLLSLALWEKQHFNSKVADTGII
ncbi:asparagine synthase (glutamine-hydrolyzing) [Elusimicrobiota bacterium]